MPCQLIEEYHKWGLEINTKKTEYICIGGIQKIQSRTVDRGLDVAMPTNIWDSRQRVSWMTSYDTGTPRNEERKAFKHLNETLCHETSPAPCRVVWRVLNTYRTFRLEIKMCRPNLNKSEYSANTNIRTITRKIVGNILVRIFE